MRLRCPICHHYRFWPHRRCQQELEKLVDQSFEAIEQRQDADSDKWTALIAAAGRSWLVQQRSLKRSVVLSHIYTGILLWWYEKVNTDDFVIYREYLNHFAKRAGIEGPAGKEHDYYRCLELLCAMCQNEADEELAKLQVRAQPDFGQFRLVWGQTPEIWQRVQSDFEPGTLTWKIAISAVALAGGLPVLSQWQEVLFTLLPLWQFIVGLVVVVWLVWFFDTNRLCFACMAIAPSGLYYGARYQYNRVLWTAIYRVQGSGHRRIRIDLEGGITLRLLVPRKDQAWLEQTIQHLMRRAQAA